MHFKCIFCSVLIKAVLGATSNVKSHLELHTGEKDLVIWLRAYEVEGDSPHNKYYIDDETMKIVNYFVARNSALSDFDSQSFKDLLSGYKRKIPCSKTFSKVILDDVYKKVYKT